MRRRLPHEPEQLLAELTSWIEWRYATSKEFVVLTSAPTTLPPVLERWIPGAVWRLAWFGNGAALLFGLAPTTGGKYLVVQHDAEHARREGTFERAPDGTWSRVGGDSLEPQSKGVARRAIIGPLNRRKSSRAQASDLVRCALGNSSEVGPARQFVRPKAANS
jgi:hypothetical protein